MKTQKLWMKKIIGSGYVQSGGRGVDLLWHLTKTKMKRITVYLLAFLLASALTAAAQAPGKFSYAAQKKFIPAELGQVYLGMSLKAFATKINLEKAEADGRFEPISLDIPLKKGNIESVRVMVHGISEEEKKTLLKTERRMVQGEFGEYERDWTSIDPAKITGKGFVYAFYIVYKDDYDLAAYTQKAFGQPADVHTEGDYYFYDKQWTKKTTDGLVWLIRSFEKETKSLQLLGRIKGTEWDPES